MMDFSGHTVPVTGAAVGIAAGIGAAFTLTVMSSL